MKLPEPVAWLYDFTIIGDDEVYTNWVTQDPTEVGKEVEGIRNVRTLYSEAQLREALASDELFGQLQEQNTYLDKVASDLQDLCDRQAKRLASHEAAMRMALDALNGLFGIPEQWTGQGGGGVSVWRLGGSDQPRAAIKALKEQLK